MVKQDYIQEKGAKTNKEEEAPQEQNLFQRAGNAIRNLFRRNR